MTTAILDAVEDDDNVALNAFVLVLTLGIIFAIEDEDAAELAGPIRPRRPPVEVRDLPLMHLVIETSNNEDWIDSLIYLYADGTDEQMDLRDIHFEMHLRRQPEDSELILALTTIDKSLSIAVFPDVGRLLIYVPESLMKSKFTGNYVGDVVATKSGLSRVCMTIDMNLTMGVTRR